ncbi:MAG: hypothetical protein OEM27_06705, partial [Nitrospinota bacterium]|nr:hypothetical protein [Nitrospinota bacterium]
NIHLKNHKNKSFNVSKPGLRALANESGAALVIALLLMIAMISLVPAALQVTSSEFDRSENFSDNRELFYMAEAGLERGKSVVQATPLNELLAGPDGLVSATPSDAVNDDNGTVAGVGDTADNAPYTWNNVAYDDVAFNTPAGDPVGTYFFRVFDNGDDADITTDSDEMVVIEGVGLNAEGDTKTLNALVRRKVLLPGTMPGAVTLTGPTSIISVGGTGFNVYGADGTGGNGYALDGTSDTSCDGQEAVSTESDGTIQYVPKNGEASCTDPTCMAANATSYPSFSGTSGNSPAIETGQDEFTGLEAERMRDELIPQATVTYSGPKNFSGVTMGTDLAPEITYFDSSLKLNGSSTGAGVLIIDGDLTISGSLDFHGVILVGSCSTCGCPTCPGGLAGTGSAQIYGAMVVGNAVNATVNFTGSADIYYSCEGIGLAESIINNNVQFSTVSWYEVNN